MDKPETKTPVPETATTAPTAPVPDAPKEPTPEAKAEVARAAAAIAAEKLRDARKAEQEKKAAPKPRRVGPLRPVHVTMLERHRAAQKPIVEELERLSARQRELETQLGTEARTVLEAIVEDLGDTVARNEIPRTTHDEETGEPFVELTRRVVAR